MTAGISENNFGFEYDREKYKDMLLDSAETILGIFGFDSTIIWKTKGQEMVDAVKEKYTERRKKPKLV